MGAMFFSSITESAFSHANTTPSNGSTNTTTAGVNDNWSNSTSQSNSTLDQSQ
jgi:hypothetical protein